MTDVTVTQEDRDALLEVLALWQCDRKQEALEHIARHRQSSTEEVERLREALQGLLPLLEGDRLIEEGRAMKGLIDRMPVRGAIRKANETLALTGVKP